MTRHFYTGDDIAELEARLETVEGRLVAAEVDNQATHQALALLVEKLIECDILEPIEGHEHVIQQLKDITRDPS